MGKFTRNGPLSIAMLVYQALNRYNLGLWWIYPRVDGLIAQVTTGRADIV
jgi:hypothetical protein